MTGEGRGCGGTDVRRWRSFAQGAIAILIVLVPGTALAQDADEGHGVDPVPIACSVSGYDLIIENTGTEPIASGASVEWSVPFAREAGNHVLTATLEPGGRVFLSGILSPSYLDSGKECVASLGPVEEASPLTP